MRRPRTTCRGLLAVVALSALATRGCILWNKSLEYEAVARRYRSQLFGDKANLAVMNIQKHRWDRDPTVAARAWSFYDPKIARLEPCVRYEEFMYRKYRRAAFLPWLPVDPDPAAPPHP